MVFYGILLACLVSFFADYNVKCIRSVLFAVHWTDKSCSLTAEAIPGVWGGHELTYNLNLKVT